MGILIPVFDDWDSIAVLLPELDRAIRLRGWTADIVLVNDGSSVPIPDAVRYQNHRSLQRVDVLHLRRNMGHQRAIAVGLAYLEKARRSLTAVVVMDGDGEDRPEDVPLLLQELNVQATGVVFAARTKRMENWRFRLMYRVYRLVHWWLTGIKVRVGNFSALSPAAMSRLVVVSELWNHYAAAVFRSRVPFGTLPLARGRRYRGKSQMNFSGLVLHGLSAISVFSDIVGIRLLVASGLLMCAAGGLLAVVTAVRLFSSLAIPGWATNAVGLLVVILVQSLMLMLVLSFVILTMRSHVNVIPLRDAGVFIEGVEQLERLSSSSEPDEVVEAQDVGT